MKHKHTIFLVLVGWLLSLLLPPQALLGKLRSKAA